jgi:SET domain-containing protein
MLVYKKNSDIHGIGVFATNNIPKNTKICDYIGIEMSWKDFLNKYGSYKLNSLNTYPMRRIWKIIVAKDEPYRSTNLVNFINEGRHPNCILKNRCLYALLDILADEELLLQYPNDYFRTW